MMMERGGEGRAGGAGIRREPYKNELLALTMHNAVNAAYLRRMIPRGNARVEYSRVLLSPYA